MPYEPRRVLRSAKSNLLTVPPGKPGKYGSRSFVRASVNLWNSLRGERAAWLKNSPTVESLKINLKTYLCTGLVMVLYVASMISLCFPHLVEVRTLSMLIVLRALFAARSMCLL